MIARIAELRDKQVVSIKDASVVGFVGDIEFDTETAKILSLVVYGRPRFFGLMGRDDDLVIPWSDIEVIGEDTVLVNCAHIPHRNKGIFGSKSR